MSVDHKLEIGGSLCSIMEVEGFFYFIVFSQERGVGPRYYGQLVSVDYDYDDDDEKLVSVDYDYDNGEKFLSWMKMMMMRSCYMTIMYYDDKLLTI